MTLSTIEGPSTSPDAAFIMDEATCFQSFCCAEWKYPVFQMLIAAIQTAAWQYYESHMHAILSVTKAALVGDLTQLDYKLNVILLYVKSSWHWNCIQ
jgi:hypothetical protein